ncbi:MAG TPA: hypothetical protein VF493_11680, partial [Terriglobales bacterium]
MVARKDHLFLRNDPVSAFAVGSLVLAACDEHEVAEDVEEAVALQYFLPEVACAIARRVGRVSSPALHLAGVASAIEREEARVLATKA